MDLDLIPDRTEPLTFEDLEAIELLREDGAPELLLELLLFKDSRLGTSDPVFHVPQMGDDVFVSLLSPEEIWTWKDWHHHVVYQPLIQIGYCAGGNGIYLNTYSVNRGQLFHLELEEEALRPLGYDLSELMDHFMTLEEYEEKYD